MVAWYMLSNESYMNRVMRDVFPTDVVSQGGTGPRQGQVGAIPLCSPKKTSLQPAVVSARQLTGVGGGGEQRT